MISIHPRMLVGGVVIIAAAGLAYFALPLGAASLFIWLVAGLVAVFIAGQATGGSPYTGLLPALKTARQGQVVQTPDGVSHELGRASCRERVYACV